MNAPAPLQHPDMTAAEWQARCDLAALYRIVDHLGWTDILNTHMSTRIPGEPNAFLINHCEEMFHEITASSLIKMDLDGNVLGKKGRFNPAGFTIHSGIYKARPDANCVMHTHTRAGAGVAMAKSGLRPISQDALNVLDEVAYHEYGTPATQSECDALGVSCQKGSCLILLKMYMLERACELELIARGLGEPPVEVAPEVVADLARILKGMRAKPEYGLHEWNALVRVVDAKGSDFRR